MTSPIVDLATELAGRGVPRFYPSAIADRLGVSIKDVVEELQPLVERGLLAVRFDLVCDECGATVKTYPAGTLPDEGEQIECFATDETHEVEVSLDNVWLSYKVTDAFKDQTEAAEGSKPPDRPRSRPRTHRWFGAVLPIRSATSTSSSLRSIST